MNLLANRHNEIGRKLLEEGALQEAEASFRKAIDVVPNWSVPWYNLGLVYKQQRKWSESLECNQRATQLNSKDKAAWWNLGIAATALGKWSLARYAWKSFGINVPEGDDELIISLAPVPIRLDLNNTREVVWCSRIDPARAIVQSVPLPSSQHRYGDLVLHDGAPHGYRVIRGKQIPVFDEIQLL